VQQEKVESDSSKKRMIVLPARDYLEMAYCSLTHRIALLKANKSNSAAAIP
jgi:hypothetical protein